MNRLITANQENESTVSLRISQLQASRRATIERKTKK